MSSRSRHVRRAEARGAARWRSACRTAPRWRLTLRSTPRRSVAFCRRWASLDAPVRTGREGLSGLQARGHAAWLRRTGCGCRADAARRPVFGGGVRVSQQARRLREDFDLGGSGLCLFAKRLEKGRFVWPPIVEGALHLTSAQLALLVEGIDWRRTVAPEAPERPSFL